MYDDIAVVDYRTTKNVDSKGFYFGFKQVL